MSLQEEIDVRSREIKTDGYPMSIGELMNLYSNREMDIHPEFQRFFRWSLSQKTKLVESILLGIPIPPIFVSQREDGVWDVVDGLQRLSTIFQFAGILKDEGGAVIEPLTLDGTDDLPSLRGKKWECPDTPEASFTAPQRLYIKRAKIDVKIILKESDQRSKYELFQRLNTGGSPLSEQEIRNCILIMENRQMHNWLRSLSQDANFREATSLSDRLLEEQYDMELALRFVVMRTLDADALRNIGDLSDFLADTMLEIARNADYDWEGEAQAFRRTFATINGSVGSDGFRRYDPDRERFVGGFLVSAFESVALGVGYNCAAYNVDPPNLRDRIKTLWVDNREAYNRSGGVRASTRIPLMVGLGREVFKP